MTKQEIKDYFAQELVIRLIRGTDSLERMHTLLDHWLIDYRHAEWSDRSATMMIRYLGSKLWLT